MASSAAEDQRNGRGRARRILGLVPLAWASLFLIETVLPPSCPRVRSLRRALPFPESSSSCRARQRDADADSHVDATWLRSNLSRVPIADFPASPEALETCVKARLPRRFRAATEAPGTRWASLLARCANYSWLMEKTAARARIPILVVPEPEATTSSSNTNGSSSLRKGDPSGTSEGPWRSRIPGFFNGSEDERREATLPFHGLLEFAKAREEGRTHFSEKFGTRMYLSQCPVLAGATCEQQGWETHRGVSGIIENRGDLPEILEGKHVCSVNLWLGVDPTVTSAHYDCHDNLLCVSRGRKIALLLPPSLKTQRFLRPRSVAARTPNDSPRTPSELLEIAERLSRDIENSPGVSGDDNTEIPRPMLAVLDPGESLFIPEGWWHQVSSSPLTTALNVFFYGHLLPPPHFLNQEQTLFDLNYPLRTLLSRTAPRAARRAFRARTGCPVSGDPGLEGIPALAEGQVSNLSREDIHEMIIRLRPASLLQLAKHCTPQKWLRALESIPPLAAYALVSRCCVPGPGESESDEAREIEEDRQSGVALNGLFEGIGGDEAAQRSMLKHVFRRRDAFVSEALREAVGDMISPG